MYYNRAKSRQLFTVSLTIYRKTIQICGKAEDPILYSKVHMSLMGIQYLTDAAQSQPVQLFICL